MNVKGIRRVLRQEVASRLVVDRATPDSTIFLSGMGRSGTTWVAEVLNYEGTHRIVFEPFNPDRVPAARPFEYLQYVNHENGNTALITSAQRILNGRVSGRWVDQMNRPGVFHRRLIKAIRSNLMLAWLRAIAPPMPIVLLIRHPLSVALSWHRLGWDVEANGGLRDCQAILSQRTLLDDFPVIETASKRVDFGDSVQRIVFQWCVMHYVPLRQASLEGHLPVFYENLLLDPQPEFERLLRHAGVSCEPERLTAALRRPSMTERPGGAADRRTQLTRWCTTFTTRQQEQARSILSMFGLEGLYVDGHPVGSTDLEGVLQNLSGTA